MMTSEEIKSRIRKLLNVAGNDASTEGEIDNALRFAKNLMDKHHLSEEDLVEEPECQYRKADAATKARFYATIGGKIYAWEAYLATFVKGFVGVEAYLDHAKRIARKPNGLVRWNEEGDTWNGKSICFYGVAEDANLATEIYYDLWQTIRAMAYLKFGTAYTKDGGSYAEGFVHGLMERIKKAKAQERIEAKTSTAMILIDRRNDLVAYKQTLAKYWLESEHKLKLRKGGGYSGASGSASAWKEGKQDGQRAEVSADKKPKLV